MLCSDSHTDWDEKINTVLMGYRASHQVTTKHSPYYIVFNSICVCQSIMRCYLEMISKKMKKIWIKIKDRVSFNSEEPSRKTLSPKLLSENPSTEPSSQSTSSEPLLQNSNPESSS